MSDRLQELRAGSPPPYTVKSEGCTHTVMHGPVPVATFSGGLSLGLAEQTARKLNDRQKASND